MSLVEPFLVEAQRTIAYARATSDPIAAHLSGELAPPVFAVVPAWESLVEAVSRVAPAEVLPLLLHGEQDIHIHRPIVPGMRLESSAEVIGTHVKASGTTVTVRSRTSTLDGELVNEQFMVAFLRGWQAPEAGGTPAPDHAFAPAGEPEKTLPAKVDEDQTFRYRDASGDYNPIHVDDEIARAAGLPGMIVHGLCTMAFTSWAAVMSLCDGDPRRLKRIAVRFSQPVLPGQEITTRFFSGGRYETVSDSGAVVIKNGLVESD